MTPNQLKYDVYEFFLQELEIIIPAIKNYQTEGFDRVLILSALRKIAMERFNLNFEEVSIIIEADIAQDMMNPLNIYFNEEIYNYENRNKNQLH